jgi:hypothetical protein
MFKVLRTPPGCNMVSTEEEEIIGRTTIFKLFMYVITKLGMLYCISKSNCLPYLHLQYTVYAYVEFVLDDKTFK